MWRSVWCFTSITVRSYPTSTGPAEGSAKHRRVAGFHTVEAPWSFVRKEFDVSVGSVHPDSLAVFDPAGGVFDADHGW